MFLGDKNEDYNRDGHHVRATHAIPNTIRYKMRIICCFFSKKKKKKIVIEMTIALGLR